MTTTQCLSWSLALSYDVFIYIVDSCSRHALLNLCLVNEYFYSIAVIRLYQDPFGLMAYEISDVVRWTKLFRILEARPHLATCVRRYIMSSLPQRSDKPSGDRMVLPNLYNLTAVEWHRGLTVNAVHLFINDCPSRNIRSVLLSPDMPDQLPQSFWAWLESQKNLKELKLPWSCDPSIIPLHTIPKLEALGASPNVARMLVPNRSVRISDGIATRDIDSPIWSLEDLESVLPHLGAGLQSIEGVKVMDQNSAAYLRLVRSWCLFVKFIHFLIDCPSSGFADAPGVVNLEDLVSALRGFNCLRTLHLTVDKESTEESVKETIEQISKDCPALSVVKWTTTARPDSSVYRVYKFMVFKFELVGGLWSCVAAPPRIE
ncbi:hypothetical protein FRB95_003356 [Tulasnella sp. JGI-2019a]|nr:hypothetical protein FRB95_003356 [Tulasnella sp. JGI-2019a]